MAESHKVLKDTHKGEDIWVIAAGPSMDHVDADFFEGKVVLGCNRVNKKFPCTYTIHKELSTMTNSILPHIREFQKNSKLILSERRFADYGGVKNPTEHADYIFTHPPKHNQKPDLNCIGKSDDIVVSYSTITSALHMAAYMGAKNIIICGHDCGTLGGRSVFKNYYTHNFKPHQGTQAKYIKWIKSGLEQHTIDVANRIREVYGIGVHSLNPFINFGLEGHEYSR